MFSFNPLHSESSKLDIILSSDIQLSENELQDIKDKIREEGIVDTPCWIYIGSKMYLIQTKKSIEKSTLDNDLIKEKYNDKEIPKIKTTNGRTIDKRYTGITFKT
jgi:hypothetical protein